MTIRDSALAEVKSAISHLPPETQAEVAACVEKLKALLLESGQAGLLAMAMMIAAFDATPE